MSPLVERLRECAELLRERATAATVDGNGLLAIRLLNHAKSSDELASELWARESGLRA